MTGVGGNCQQPLLMVYNGCYWYTDSRPLATNISTDSEPISVPKSVASTDNKPIATDIGTNIGR